MSDVFPAASALNFGRPGFNNRYIISSLKFERFLVGTGIEITFSHHHIASDDIGYYQFPSHWSLQIHTSMSSHLPLSSIVEQLRRLGGTSPVVHGVVLVAGISAVWAVSRTVTRMLDPVSVCQCNIQTSTYPWWSQIPTLGSPGVFGLNSLKHASQWTFDGYQKVLQPQGSG